MAQFVSSPIAIVLFEAIFFGGMITSQIRQKMVGGELVDPVDGFCAITNDAFCNKGYFQLFFLTH
ncbi:MAG: hypothetical protein K2P98_05550 [Neisseriaceae bacterium]|nr:hypothetical protein [Neisseriaceae bacterium]